MVDLFSISFYIIGAIFLLSLGSALPGLAAVRVLDPTADRWRTALLAPALGLLLMYGVAGWSVIILGVYSNIAIFALIILLNIIAIRILEKKQEKLTKNLSKWKQLEIAMNSSLEEDESELLGNNHQLPENDHLKNNPPNSWQQGIDEEMWTEVEEQKAVRNSRPKWWAAPLSVAVFVSLLPLFIFEFPHGVDWIGFATLTHRFAEVGQLSLPPPSVGYWTYPPAFPAVAAFLEQGLGIGPETAVHILGRLSLLILLLGIAGVSDRWGSAMPTLIAIGLAAGIFAKAHDSGWPTISSQLGLVLGLLVVLRPAVKQRIEHNFAFGAGVLSVAVIHPTGAIYLGTLLFANILMRYLNGRSDERGLAVAAISSSLLALAAAATLLLFAPRLLQADIFAEYGWQGGWPMLMYTSPLLPFAIWSGWKLRQTLEGSILIMWLLLQWSLTFIHLLSGWAIPVLSLFSFSLYSMGLHGFHLPAAILVGLAFTRGVKLTPLPKETKLNLHETQIGDGIEKPEVDEELENRGAEDAYGADYSGDLEFTETLPLFEVKDSAKNRISIMVLAIILVSGSQIALLGLASHPELYSTTGGDRAIIGELGNYVEQGKVVYIENSHWGYSFDIDSEIAVSTHPVLGLIHLEESIQSAATTAIRYDDIETLNRLNITHAVTSPMGGLIWTLTSSPWWSIELEIDGARLWRLSTDLIPESEGWISSIGGDVCITNDNCQLRKDPWKDQRHWNYAGGSSERSFIDHGEISWSIQIPPTLSGREIIPSLLLEGSEGIIVRVTLESGTWKSSQISDIEGWTMIKLPKGIPAENNISVLIEILEGGGDAWINPLGLSGRGDRILDSDGVYIHWLELRPI